MTSKLLSPIDPPLLAGALQIVRRLRQKGHEAYFAGGVVRDLLRRQSGRGAVRPGREEFLSDIDIATSAPPHEVENLFEKTVPLGKQFGVVVVVVNAINYEVTTFRKESDYLDGRHPTRISFTGREEDARRRDFTVNALFLDPLTEEVLDLVEGKADLEAGLLRTVGPAAERFQEDKLRVLRVVRLACQLDFEIEEETWRQVALYAGSLIEVSGERLRDELTRILTGPAPARGLRLALESGILEAILPEVAAMDGVEQPPAFHPEGDVFTHTCLMLDSAREPQTTLAWGILLHDVGKPPTFTIKDRIRFDRHAEVGAQMAAEIGRRFRLSGLQVAEVVDLVKDHLRFIHVQEMRDSTLKRFLRKENIGLHLELHRLDCLASHGDLSSYEFCLEKLRQLSREEMRPQPLLSGYDLIAAGLEPGPVFSTILRHLEDLQLEGQIRTRDEALSWLQGWVR